MIASNSSLQIVLQNNDLRSALARTLYRADFSYDKVAFPK